MTRNILTLALMYLSAGLLFAIQSGKWSVLFTWPYTGMTDGFYSEKRKKRMRETGVSQG